MDNEEEAQQTDARGLDEHPRPVQQPAGVVKKSICTPHQEKVAKEAFSREGAGDNGDEQDYPDYSGNFHKGLRHPNDLGEVDKKAYEALRQSLLNRDKDPAFENAIGLYRDDHPYGRQLINPQAGFSGDTEGPNPKDLTIPPAPKVDSGEAAAEAVELYWMALLRDVPFSRFQDHPLVAAACEELGKFKAFRGPRDERDRVTPATLFRGSACGDLVGPYVSQFLLMGTNTLPHRTKTRKPPVLADFQAGKVLYGAVTIDQRITPAATGVDYMTTFADWLKIQNGEMPATPDQFTTSRFIMTPRDLATYVHFDALYQAYLTACLILLEIGAPWNPGLPFDPDTTRQEGFGTFGGPHVLSLVTEVATRALKCIWRQKWMVHRRARPEAVGGLLECHRLKPSGPVPFIEPLSDWLDDADVLPAVLAAKGSHLLPMAFPEGSPMHPSYGAGHATVAGACVTILKAFFDESYKLPFAFQANPADNGATLEHLPGFDDTLTVGGELNKVCSNVAIGRNMAGVHYFTDYIESIRLGEKVACAILEEQAVCYPEDFSMTFSSFDRASDGSPIDISIEKTGDAVVKRQQVRSMTVPASPMILPIAAE